MAAGPPGMVGAVAAGAAGAAGASVKGSNTVFAWALLALTLTLTQAWEGRKSCNSPAACIMCLFHSTSNSPSRACNHLTP